MNQERIWLGSTTAAIAFVRVSSHRQKDNTSHETQEKEVLRYCAEHGLDLKRIVRIVESAADSEKRHVYIAAQARAMKEGIRHQLFYVSDRETRNLTDNERNEVLVRQDLIVIHYVRDRQVLHLGSAESEFVMRDFLAVQNKQFIRALRAKVIDSQRTKAESGWYPLNHPPMGYAHQRLKDDNGRDRKRGTIIVPDPVTQNVRRVVREFELRSDGHALTEVRRRIIAEGFINADKVASYHISALEYRLKNRFYAGFFTFRGEEYKGAHDLIIDPALWKEVQRTFGRPHSRRASPGIFGGGWLRCGVATCSCVITYEPKPKLIKATGERRVFEYYRCANGRHVHSKLLYVSEQTIWDQFGAALDSITITKTFAQRVTEALNETQIRAKTFSKHQARGHQEALTALEAEEDRLYADLRSGLLDDMAYQRQIKKIRSQRTDLNDRLADAQSAVSEASLETAKSILELAMSARSLWESRSHVERRDLLETVLSNRTLEGKTIRYDLKKPFALLAQMQQTDEWRPRQDSNLRPQA